MYPTALQASMFSQSYLVFVTCEANAKVGRYRYTYKVYIECPFVSECFLFIGTLLQGFTENCHLNQH